jgi:hypothetical protein
VHDITLICSDSKGLSINKKFTLTVYQAPKFASSVANKIDLISNNLDNYTLPIMDGIAGEYIIHSSSLPRFVTFNSPLYQFFPDKVSDLGISTISG